MTPLQPAPIDWSVYHRRLEGATGVRQTGTVEQVIGLVLESRGPGAALGELCHVTQDNGANVPAQVVGFRRDRVLLLPLDDLHGVRPGASVVASGHPPRVRLCQEMLGRVLGGLGTPLDDGPPLPWTQSRQVLASPPPAFHRDRVLKPLATGVRAIDALTMLGKGQRMGIFSGSGVGKSTMMGMIARNTSAQVNVIAMIGERGREVREFIEKDLGEEGLQRSVVVVSTSDAPALQRIQGAYVAMTIAEYFRDQGHDVMLMMDSVTRFATALREVGLSVGEPPTTRGYTPSVFATLPRFLERAGPGTNGGSITGLFTILVESDDMNDPVADAVRAILDGHVVLTRRLAERNHYPAIDVLASVSRVMPDIAPQEHLDAAARLRRVLAVYQQAEDLIDVGAYQKGANPEIDDAIQRLPSIQAFLRQEINEHIQAEDAVAQLQALWQGKG